MGKYKERGESTDQKSELLDPALHAFLPDHVAFHDTDTSNTGHKIDLPAPAILQH